MPVQARSLLRKMRGGAQAHLMAADDGHHYVVKFRNNPQHRRILVNEWLAAAFLRHLQVLAPSVAIVELSQSFLTEHSGVHLQLGPRRVEVEPGWHFGSRYPGDPARLAVYDFLPDSLLPKVENRRDFLGALVVDKWLGNADARQAVFFRAPLREWLQPRASPGLRVGFVALMVDHGFAFNGPHWDFLDSPRQGVYFRPQVYSEVVGLDSFQPWLDQAVHCPIEVFDSALKTVPPPWMEGDDGELERLLEKLWRRRKRIPDLIVDCHASFQKWRNGH